MGRFNSSHTKIFSGQSLIDRPLKGEMIWQAPSNLALIKYWGKKGHQLPGNPSLSLTLRQSVTILETQFFFDPQRDQQADLASLWTFEFQADNSSASGFGKKIFSHLEAMKSYYPFLGQTQLNLKSWNTFPHSAGIASSASSAMGTALMVEGIASLLGGQESPFSSHDPIFLQRASFLARLGSGSAARSAFAVGSLWGDWDDGISGHDEWAVGVAKELPYLKNLEDMILVVDHSKKKISSREGHELMNNHPYRQERYHRALERLSSLWSVMAGGESSEDFHKMGPLIEAEALDLHALMMSSNPPVVLMCPETLAIIMALWQWRAEAKAPIYFTLDAGPNIHLLYPKTVASALKEFLKLLQDRNLLPAQIIEDGVGFGPELVSFKLKS